MNTEQLNTFFSLSEQVTSRLLNEADVLVLELTPTTFNPDLLVMAPRRMPVFLFLRTHTLDPAYGKGQADTKARLDDQQCAWFDVQNLDDLEFLIDAIRTLRRSGEIKSPRCAAGEGFEVVSQSDTPTEGVAVPSRSSWMD